MAQKPLEPTVSKVIDSFKEGWDATINRREAFLDFYNNYRQVYSTDEEARFLNNVFSTLTYETVETFRPYLTQYPPDLGVVPREEGDTEGAKRLEEWQRYQWYCQNMERKQKSLAWYILVYGTGLLYHFYRLESAKVPLRIRDPFTGEVTLKDKMVRVYDDPDCQVIDIVNDFVPDPFGRTLQDCNYIIIRRYIHKNDVKRMSQGEDPWFQNEVSAKELGDLYDDRTWKYQQELFDRYRDSQELLSAAKRNMVEVMEYWEEDRVVVVANREFLLRDSKNPHYMLSAMRRRPFTLFRDIDNPHELWGIGEAEIVCKGQHELNSIKRMRIDAAKRILRQGWVAPLNSGFDPSGFYESDSDYVVESNMSEFLKPINPPQLELAGLQSESDIKLDQENATGAGPLFKSGVAQRTATATGDRIGQANIMSRANYKLDNFNEGFKSWMEINAALAAQYYPEERSFRVLNDKGFQVKDILYVDLVSGVDYEIASASSKPLTKEDRMMQADILMARYNQDPFVRQRELREVVMQLSETPYRDKLLKTEEEVAAEQQQAMQQAQQMQQAQMEQQATTMALESALKEDTAGVEALPGQVEGTERSPRPAPAPY